MNPIIQDFKYKAKSRNEHPYWGDTYDSFTEWLDHATEKDAYCKKHRYNNAQIRKAKLILQRYGSFVLSLERSDHA